MRKVVRLFDINDDGRIDYYEFISSLHPRDSYKPMNDADKIEDEVIREVAQCRCCDRFNIEQISDNKYRFGDSQQLRLVRILKNSVMVRVGGGWASLTEFLSKNDPCRGKKSAKSRKSQPATLPDPLADGVSQSMASFSRRSRSRNLSPSSVTSSPSVRLKNDSRQSSRLGSRQSSAVNSRDTSPVSRIPVASGLLSPRTRRKTTAGGTPSGIRTPSSVHSRSGIRPRQENPDRLVEEAVRRVQNELYPKNTKT